MSIKRRLVLSTVIVFILLVVTGATILLGYSYVVGRVTVVNKLDRELMSLQMMLRGVNEVIITEGTPASVEIAASGIKGFDEIHKELKAEIKKPGIQKIISEKIDPTWEKIKVNVQPFLERDLDVEAEGLMIKYGGVITDTSHVIDEVKMLSEQTRAIVNANSGQSALVRKVIIIILSVMIVVFVFMSYRTYRSILAPISDLTYIAEGFNSGDLSIRMDASRNDEFGTLAGQFNGATYKLSEMISRVIASTNTVASHSEDLSASISQIAAHTREQSQQTTQAASATEELNSSFIEVARNTTNAAESAKNASELAVKGGDVVNETVSIMNQISQTVKKSADSIESLGNNSEKIGEVVQVINDIAAQTNLLALNAAIEAARAGEQGRGFAVVADEVRKLAEKTTSATNEIAEMIKDIQDDTGRAISDMNSGTEKVEAGVGSANEAGESLTRIVDAVHNVTDTTHQIATAAEEQTSTGGEIASNIESVASLTGQTADKAQDSAEATRELNSLAQNLLQLVGGFKLSNEETLNDGTNQDSIDSSVAPQGDGRKQNVSSS